MKTAVSYLRFSSTKQSGNDSYRRQIESTLKFCEANNLQLSERLEDLGISGWSGKNLDDTAALGGFLKLVEAGKIPQGTVLICENLDRLSRAKILDALGLFTNILRNGVDVVTTMDGKWYSKQSVTDNPMELMTSIIYLTRGNNESETKSIRVRSSWTRRHDAIKNGEFAKFRCPCWLKHDGKQYSLIEKSAETIRLIYDLYLQGHGASALIQELNRRKIKSFTKTGKWNLVFIHEVLQNVAVIGTCSKVNPPKANYYPAVISEDIFYRAINQRKMNANYAGKLGQKDVNILGGVIKCHKCGGSMIKYSCKSKDGKKTYNHFICAKSKVKLCEYTFTSEQKMNDSFLSVLTTNNFKSLIQPKTNSIDNTETIKGKLETITKTIARVARAVVLTESDTLEQELKSLEIEKARLQAEYENEKALACSHDDSADMTELLQSINQNLAKRDYRIKLRNFIRRTIKTIIINGSGYTVHFMNHPETITVTFEKDCFQFMVNGERFYYDYDSFKVN